MKLILLIISLVAVCFTSLARSQLHCNRCYGNSYCNNATIPDFNTNIRNATCNVATYSDIEINDPYLKHIQKAINENILKDLNDDGASLLNSTIEGHCITATVHEPHDSHTLRTCVTRVVPAGSNVTLCALMNTIIAPLNWFNGTFTCRACNGTNFCNNQTLTIGDGIQDSAGASNLISTSFGIVIVAITTLYRLN